MFASRIFVFLPAQLFRRILDFERADLGFIVGERDEQCGVADRVDQPWDAARITVDQRISVFREKAAVFTPCHFQSMFDVLAHIVLVECTEVKAQSNALHELFKLG